MAQKASGSAYVSASPLSDQLTTATITDPSLNNMVAATMTIPAGWKLEGIEMMPPCTAAPSPVYRAYSPDGLMQLSQEPILGWHWSAKGATAHRQTGKENLGPSGGVLDTAPVLRVFPKNPRFRLNQNGCAQISGVMSAADFLKYYVETTMQGGVHIVGPMPVPASFSQVTERLRAQFDQDDSRLPPMPPMKYTADTAALRVQVVNGLFVLEERLWAAADCGVNTAGGPSASGQCIARVDVLTAPQWKQATFQQLAERNARQGAAMLSRMMYSAFQQNIARSAAQHAAFMQQQESSFRSSTNRATTAMNARSTAASDWVDYALDQKTVTGSGGTVKASNAYSQPGRMDRAIGIRPITQMQIRTVYFRETGRRRR